MSNRDQFVGAQRHVALWCIPAFCIIQTLALTGDSARAERVFIVLTCLAAFQTALAALLCAFGADGQRRCLWLVLAFLLWIGGQIATLIEGSVSGIEGSLHSSVLLFSLFGMPFLAVAAASRGTLSSRLTLILDSVTVVTLTYAFLLYNADVVSQSLQDAPRAFALISRNFFIEGVLLALVSVGRLFAAETQEDWGLFFVLSEFLVVDLALATWFNYGGADSPAFMVRAAVYGLMPAPFLWLAWRLSQPLPTRKVLPLVTASPRAMLISVGPSLLTISLVLLAAQLMTAHPALSGVFMVIAIALYVVRNMVTQSWLIQNRDALAESERELRTIARTDPLTGIGNRRLFDEAFEIEWDRATRAQTSIALLLLDVDTFKAYNDTYGHEAGDRCLQSVALALRVALPRAGDVIARYGGEEFAVLLPNTTAANAGIVAQRVHDQIRAFALPHASSPLGIVSVSIGVSAVVPRRGDLYQTLMADADLALYAAKRAGRNRTEVVTPVTPDRPSTARI